MLVLVEAPFQPYIQAAATRLGYLYPKVRFEPNPSGIAAADDSGVATETLVREIHYALYREKIYAETLAMRRALLDAVTRR